MEITDLLTNDGYIIVNKKLIQLYGLEEAIIIGELSSEYNYYKQRGQITEDGLFYSTVENIEKNTSLSKHQQLKALKHLEEEGLIKVHIKGLPAKRYIEQQFGQILNNQLSKNWTTSCSKIEQLDVQKLNTNNNNINNNKYNTNKEYKENYIKERWQEQFEEFWKVYPKKQNKKKTEQWFKKYKPPENLFKTIINKVEKFKETKDWQKENGKYIPMATTWLNGERWNDEVEVKQDNIFLEIGKEESFFE